MMLYCVRPSFRAAVAFGLLGFSTAARGDELRLESATLPAPLIGDGKTNTVIEASGVEPIGDGSRLLVAHDKLPGLYVVEAATGRLVGEPLTSAKFPPASKIGPKWEGMSRDAQGNFYLIGAHVGKTDEERTAKSYLFRFRLKDGPLPAIDEESVVRWRIERSLVDVLKAAGLDEVQVAKRKIEGLAYREVKGSDGAVRRREILIGLREPGDRVRGFVADVTREPSPEAELELKSAFTFEADAREGVESQLTSLEYVPALGGLLVVTASEDKDNAFHGNTLYFLPDASPDSARKVATFEVAMKAEGLAVMGVEGSPARTVVKLLITYDNDPHATHIPSRFQTVELVRDAR